MSPRGVEDFETRPPEELEFEREGIAGVTPEQRWPGIAEQAGILATGARNEHMGETGADYDHTTEPPATITIKGPH